MTQRRWRSTQQTSFSFNATTDAREDATPKIKQLTERYYDYPASPFVNVPNEDEPIAVVRRFCFKHFPRLRPPGGPGLTDQGARDLVYIASVTDQPVKVPPEVHNLAEKHGNWRIAYVILLNEGINMMEVLSSNIYGDSPSWVSAPPTNLVMTHQRPPKTAEAMEAILASVVKNLRGKPTDVDKYSILSISRSPSTIQQCSIFAIPKHWNKSTGKHLWQIVWNGRDSVGRTVYHHDNVSVTLSPAGGLRMVLRTPAPELREWADEVNVPFNLLQMDKNTYQVSTTKYSEVKSLRGKLIEWHNTAVSLWIDLKSGYSQAKASPLTQHYTGFEIPGTDIHCKVHSFCFGSSLSCVGFQSKTSIVPLLCKTLWPAIFKNSRKAVCFAYIDDICCLAKNMAIGKLCFKYIMEVINFLGFLTAPDKISKPGPVNVILGLEIDGRRSAIKCSEDRAKVVLDLLKEFQDDPLQFPVKQYESLLGMLSFLAYQTNFGRQYMVPLYALKWATPARRVALLHSCPSPLAQRVRSALRWWHVKLTGDRVLWSAAEAPTQWYETNSDASNKRFGSFDTFGNVCVGDFGDVGLKDEIIAFKELFSITQHLREFPPPNNTSIRMIIDNMNVVHAINQNVAKGSESFKQEFNDFHRMCEKNAITCITTYCRSKDNLLTDMMSRTDCRLTIEMLRWCGIQPKVVAASETVFNELRATKRFSAGAPRSASRSIQSDTQRPNSAL